MFCKTCEDFSQKFLRPQIAELTRVARRTDDIDKEKDAFLFQRLSIATRNEAGKHLPAQQLPDPQQCDPHEEEGHRVEKACQSEDKDIAPLGISKTQKLQTGACDAKPVPVKTR